MTTTNRVRSRLPVAFTLPVLLLLAPLATPCGETPATDRLGRLRVLNAGYPRAYFFRASEIPGKSPRLTYTAWEKSFARLMGIEGKALDEEIPGLSSRNVEFFTRFKERHPEQLVLLHFNGNARDPRFDAAPFFAGHWVYFNGARIRRDVPATAGESAVHVSDATLFRVEVGRYRDRNEDVGLCELNADGKPDWSRSEQVQLLAVDTEQDVIRVRRGCYGTTPRAFTAGRAYAAAHVSEGPWGRRSNLLWFYNYSTACPPGPDGRRAADVLIDDLIARFEEGGQLGAFDGIEFDVLFFENRYHRDLRRRSKRGMDVNADGEIDGGVLGGRNVYGLGVTEFCRRLRARFPRDRLLLADGMAEGNQRSFEILNGIESEGFPHLRDLEMRDWSGGLNRHTYWSAHARAPVFNYVNHKYTRPNPETHLPERPDVPFGIHRLAFAAAVFTDAAICYSFAPRPEPGERIGIWDELRQGRENQLGWLGRPLGPAVHLAERGADLLAGSGQGPLRGAAQAAAGQARFVVENLPARGPDLFVTFRARAEPRRGDPPEIARLLRARIADSTSRGFMAWVGREDSEPGFYFSEVRGEKVSLELTVEGTEAVSITRLRAFAHPDTMYREFEHGVVLANPSPRPYTFPVADLFPGGSFRRLEGSPQQDPRTNDGSPVGREVVLPGKDALFLVRR